MSDERTVASSDPASMTRPQTLLGDWSKLPSAESLASGDRLGPYLLLKQLGSGGMGVVWLAEQTEPVVRKVAIKLVQRQLRGSLAEAYFQVERQALAQMNHPCIARIYDAGSLPDGSLFFAMEYIEGELLDDWLRRSRPSTRATVLLLMRLAQGIQHAHQKGMLHRDLKPGNVLVAEVDGQPLPKIIDFGVAVGLDQHAKARVRDRVGTQAYMAPEQADPSLGVQDARVDVYALGAVLAEALLLASGAVIPDSGQVTSHTLRSVFAASIDGSQPSPDASRLAPVLRRIPRELRAIAVKAMAQERDARYESAAALADDLGRWLDRQPVRAMPASRWYQASCFIARHRLGLVAAGLIALALAGGLVTALYGLGEARAGRAQAELQAARAQQTAHFLGEVLGSVDPARARDLDKTLLREVLDAAAARAARELAAVPAVEAEIQQTIADTYQRLGEYELAVRHFQRAIDLTPEAALRERLLLRARIVAITADVQRGKAAQEAAEPLYREFVESLGAADPATLRMESMLQWYTFMAGGLQQVRDRAVPLLEALRAAHGPDHPHALFQQKNTAVFLGEAGQFEASEQMYQDLIRRRIARDGEDATETLSDRQGLAILYLQHKRYADGERVLKPLVEVLRRRYGTEHMATINTTANLAGALRQGGKLAESEPYYRAALEAATRRYGAEAAATLPLAINYANYELAAGDAEGSLARLRGLREAQIRALGPGHMSTAEMHRAFARAYTALGRKAEAAAAWREAIAIDVQVFGEDHPKTREDREALRALEDGGATPSPSAHTR